MKTQNNLFEVKIPGSLAETPQGDVIIPDEPFKVVLINHSMRCIDANLSLVGAPRMSTTIIPGESYEFLEKFRFIPYEERSTARRHYDLRAEFFPDPADLSTVQVIFLRLNLAKPQYPKLAETDPQKEAIAFGPQLPYRLGDAGH